MGNFNLGSFRFSLRKYVAQTPILHAHDWKMTFLLFHIFSLVIVLCLLPPCLTPQRLHLGTIALVMYSMTVRPSLTWNSLDWLASSFDIFSNEPCTKFFKNLYSHNDTLLWLEKQSNKYGLFVEFTQLRHSSSRRKLLILSEENKHEWFSFFLLFWNTLVRCIA